MQKIPEQEYTAEFKEQAVLRAREVGIGVASRKLGLVAQTLRNWFKAAVGGTLNGAGAKAVTSELAIGAVKKAEESDSRRKGFIASRWPRLPSP